MFWPAFIFVSTVIFLLVAIILYGGRRPPKDADAVTLMIMAVVGFITNMFTKQEASIDSQRLAEIKGRTVLITGANRGLGAGIATDLASLGYRVVLACRSGIPEIGPAIVKAANERALSKGRNVSVTNADVLMVRLDLGDFDSVVSCVQQLKAQKIKLHAVIVNAVVLPIRGEVNKYGFETAIGVNYVGHFLLLERLMSADILPVSMDAVVRDPPKSIDEVPRIIVVSSESHRVSTLKLDEIPIDKPMDFGVSGATKIYAQCKLLLIGWASELNRRLNRNAAVPRVWVTTLCPGPVDSNIAHHAPAILQLLVKPMFKLFFKAPIQAAQPITKYLTENINLSDQDNRYYHMWKRTPPREDAFDAQKTEQLWNRTAALLRRSGF